MFAIAIKSIIARRARILLTAVAVIAGTSFLSGTFIFSDTINQTFNNLFTEVFKDVDSYVRSTNVIEADFGDDQRERVSLDLAEKIAQVDGVADAQSFIQGSATVIKADGKPLESTGPPAFGGTINSGKLSPWKIAQGRVPAGPNEVAFDKSTADKAGYKLNDTVKVASQAGSREFTLVGIVRYGGVNSPGGAQWALFDTATASDFVAKPGLADAVLVTGDGSVDDATLSARIAAKLGPDFEALTGAEITKETQSDIATATKFITIFLTVFSLIALAVGIFVIYNVFSVTAAQRQRENALLRAIGASRRQVTAAMLLEAFMVGVVGSLLGLLAGVGISKGLQSLFSAIGIDIPLKGLVLSTRTIVVTLIAGLLATMIAGILPALRSGRVLPIAAMRETALENRGPSRSRIVAAILLAAVGALEIAAVVSGARSALLGLAVVQIFVAVLLLGPLMAAPMARFLGKPIAKTRGLTGAMASQNVARNPKRTARTAAPVLIGVALVTGASVFAASIKTQINDVVGQQFVGDYVIQAGGGGPGALGMSPSLLVDLRLPEVEVATGLGFTGLAVGPDKSTELVTTVDPATASKLLDVSFVQGSFADLTPDGVLVSKTTATKQDLALGSPLDIQTVEGTRLALTVQGIYEKDEILGKFTVDQSILSQTTGPGGIAFVFIQAAKGVSDSDFRAAVEPVVKSTGIGKLQSRSEFIKEASGQINQILGLIYGLLALSIIIAIFGIVLTLLLSVYERRRETGLLRAVGMTRSQVRQTVRWESVITSVYGAIVGVVLGLVVGYVIVLSLRSQGFKSFSVPVPTIISILIIAIVVGVLAAVVPARRATKTDILAAIATT